MVAGLGDVAMADDQAADFLRQRLDPLFQRVALIGEGELGALRVAGLGDAPGDRAVVGDPHDQAALAAHETRGFRHAVPRCGAEPAASYGIGPGPFKQPPVPAADAQAAREYRPAAVLYG